MFVWCTVELYGQELIIPVLSNYYRKAEEQCLAIMETTTPLNLLTNNGRFHYSTSLV